MWWLLCGADEGLFWLLKTTHDKRVPSYMIHSMVAGGLRRTSCVIILGVAALNKIICSRPVCVQAMTQARR